MICRAWHIDAGRATPVDPMAAVDTAGGFLWIHLHGEGDAVAAWLRDHARLPDYVIDPLTAVETRPRCDAIGKGAFVNLRGLSDDVLSSADPLASVRLYASAGRVHSVTRRKLTAFHTVVDRVEGARSPIPAT